MRQNLQKIHAWKNQADYDAMNGSKTPANADALRAIKDEITKDICEIEPGKWYRDDNPKLLVLTTDHLDLILRRRLLGEDI